MSKKAYKKKEEIKSTRVMVRLDKQLCRDLNNLMWMLDKSKSDILREALKEYADRWL